MKRGFGLPGRTRFWMLAILGALLVGFYNANIVLTSGLAEHSQMPAAFPYIMELTGSLTALLLIPLIVWLALRVPVDRRNWWRQVPLHWAASLVFGTVHTFMMWGSRNVIYRLFDWGSYDYGDMRYRFVMEYQKQLILYVTVYAITTTVQYVRRNRERELRAARLESRLTEARLTALKAQLNPHFLFNTLNLISSLVHDEPDRADHTLSRLADFLRLAMSSADRQLVPLDEEMAFVRIYLEIMEARFRDRLVIETELEAQTGRVMVPHLLLQPLIENAIVHSSDDPERTAIVRLGARRDADRLILTIQDNGPGLGSGDGPPGKGIGLTNTISRLEQLYGDEQEFDIENAPAGGCRVTVTIPWSEEALR